jgi:hypothetical protein
MRRLVGALAAVVLTCTGCTSWFGGDDDAEPQPSSAEPSTSLASIGIDWPEADGELAVPDELIGRMAGLLTDWAQVSTLDEDARYSAAPIDEVAATLPEKVGAALRAQTKDAVSPGLGVANVFADDVTVVGAPRVTTAWKISSEVDDADAPYVLLELQTRAAYEVRVGDDGPTRVVGVLRVHGLSAYPGTTDDFGVSGGWQEFGAVDCALATDDDLVPDSNLQAAELDLQTFVTVGSGERVEMPSLGDDQQVDAEYLERCRNSST